VRGDFKSNRVKDPTAPIGSKHEKTVKAYVKDYMDRAVKKKTEREKAKTAQAGAKVNGAGAAANGEPSLEAAATEAKGKAADSEEGTPDLGSREVSPTASTTDLKRKREEERDPGSPKKSKTESAPDPPPPPPPPAEDMMIDADGTALTPMEDDRHGVLTSKDRNEASINGKPRLQYDDLESPMQLATPPGKETGDDADGRSNNMHKHLVTANSSF